MKTIKAFYRDKKGYYCKPNDKKFYYEKGEIYKADDIKLCLSGFHASSHFDISDTIDYYDIAHARYGIVDLNVIESSNGKCVGDKIKILEFLPDDFNILSAYDRTGEWIYNKVYREISNYELGFQKLLQIDEIGRWIYEAGRNWKRFDYKTAFRKLLEVDKKGLYIYWAGKTWKQFDHKLGLERLLEVDQTGEVIYYAGRTWKQFDSKTFSY
jgi:hypothetical protein